MNQYYGNNETEVLNLGMDRSRYPYAQNPNSQLQSMNYKDWMDMCTSRESGEVFSATRDGVIISSAVISLTLSVSFPVAAAAIGILSVLLSVLWPADAGDPGTTPAQVSWEQLMNKVEVLVGNEISSLVRTQAINTLAKLQSRIRDYHQAICNLQASSPADPNYESYKSDVRREFNDAEDEAKSAIIDLKSQGYEILLLASYAQAANLHLLLLRDVVQYGESWGFSAREVEQYYSNTGLIGNRGMLELLAIYTDYCVQWYNTGLQQQYATDNWDKFNDFRRDMTIMVLDTVSLWPTYNPKFYDRPTKSQLTRTVYTQLVGPSTAKTWGLDFLEHTLVPTPTLFRWLDTLIFYRNNDALKQYAGLTNKFRYTLGTDIITYSMGSTTNLVDQIEVNTGRGVNGIWKTSNVLEREQLTSSTVQTFSFYLLQSENPNIPVTIGTVYNADNISNTYGLPCHPTTNCGSDTCIPCTTAQPNELVCDTPGRISHSLASVTARPWFDSLPTFTYGWSHLSANANNLIDTEKITQIPAVKAYRLFQDASVIQGPGSTGGDVVSISQNSACIMEVTGQLQKAYQVRIRYACQGTGELYVERGVYDDINLGWSVDYGEFVSVPSTSYSDGALTYNSFGYVTLPIPLDYEFVNNTRWEMSFTNSGNTTIIIDKIEFIPITGSLIEYESTQRLENARKAVNALFTNDTKSALRMDVTDYDVDQAANKVDCMSDDMFPKEKMMLRDQVKHAKRLSQARNLLNYGDFESSNWSNENGWRVSNSVTVQADQPISRGRYLNMPGARSMEFSNTLYPTYAYQRVNESKLKPYTRYLVRGFVGSATELELFVTRYGKEIHDTMNIPFRSMNTWKPTNRISNRCGTGQVSAYTMPNDPCQTNTYATNPSGIPMSSTNGWCEDKQHFVFPMDVGEIYPRADLGIGIGFKISSTSGMAQLDNLEVIEANPLTGEALARVKKREQKWKREMEQECALTEKTVSAATQAVNALFTSQDHNRLKLTITMQDILHAEKKVNNIPYVQNPYFEEIPGMNYAIFQSLQSDVQTAFVLYTQRNVIRNGDFSSGLLNWYATAGANVQQRDGNPHVLVISQWNANVSQEVCVQPEHGYVLRVTARKEGSGKGYVTISDCTEANTETVTFTSDEWRPTPPSSVRPERPAEPGICDTTRYSESLGITPEINEQPESYRTGSCSCGGGNMSHTPSTTYQTRAYESQPSMQNRNPSSSGYITKTIEIFPETNRMRIEMGETEGTFLVENIELICMED
ncbi:insecticidal delta-endotoxin Cry8Ea1 family protein [Bacillus toyonensis]|uniref:insecticidal delta-endotoxin Cry8Ea1 family protein n=1 Tax=Bacillus toyonensis TaxID=155322 RepID=UPI0034676F2E